MITAAPGDTDPCLINGRAKATSPGDTDLYVETAVYNGRSLRHRSVPNKRPLQKRPFQATQISTQVRLLITVVPGDTDLRLTIGVAKVGVLTRKLSRNIGRPAIGSLCAKQGVLTPFSPRTGLLPRNIVAERI